MQNSLSKFYQNLFQYSNFVLIHFNYLSFKFIQLRLLCQLSFKKKKNTRKYFSIINWIFFFNFKILNKIIKYLDNK